MVRQKIRKHLAKAYRQMLKIHKFVVVFAGITERQFNREMPLIPFKRTK